MRENQQRSEESRAGGDIKNEAQALKLKINIAATIMTGRCWNYILLHIQHNNQWTRTREDCHLSRCGRFDARKVADARQRQKKKYAFNSKTQQPQSVGVYVSNPQQWKPHISRHTSLACNLWRAHDPPTFIFYITHKEVINLLGYVFATIVRCRHGYAATPLYGTNVITKATTVARECVSSPF